MEEMMDFKNPEMKQYFESLPFFVQESIKQNGVTFTNLAELENCAKGMLNQK